MLLKWSVAGENTWEAPVQESRMLVRLGPDGWAVESEWDGAVLLRGCPVNKLASAIRLANAVADLYQEDEIEPLYVFVTSSDKKSAYVVNLQSERCSCLAGRMGRQCKHIGMAETILDGWTQLVKQG